MAKPLVGEEITLQQRKFVKEVVKGNSLRQASRNAGLSPTYGSFLKKQDSIKSMLVEEFAKIGIDDALIAKKIKQGFNAKTKPLKEGGKQYEDQFVRKQFIDMAMRARGDYAPDELNINQRVIHVHVTPEVAKGLIDAGVVDKEEFIEGEVIDAE